MRSLYLLILLITIFSASCTMTNKNAEEVVESIDTFSKPVAEEKGVPNEFVQQLIAQEYSNEADVKE